MRRDALKRFEEGDQVGNAVDAAAFGNRFQRKIGRLQVVFDDVYQVPVAVLDGRNAEKFFVNDPKISYSELTNCYLTLSNGFLTIIGNHQKRFNDWKMCIIQATLSITKR